jgi:hypothetical protein
MILKWQNTSASTINTLTPELNPSAQRCLPRFFTGILIFKAYYGVRM